jgi:hypothetical protein
MDYGFTFKNFLLDNNISAELAYVNSNDEPFIFLKSFVVDELVKQSYATCVPSGGLIIGNFHNQGGIHMLQPFDNGFKYVGEMEGYEFLFSAEMTKKHLAKIFELNKSVTRDRDSEPKPFKVPRHIKKIDLTKLHFQIMVMPDGLHFILNRTATEKYLVLLDEMNDNRKLKKLWRLFGL